MKKKGDIYRMLLELNNLTKYYKNGSQYQEILKNLDFKVQEGDSIAIKGKSGCGKSTLLNIIGGLLPFEKGTMIFKDKNISKMTENEQAEYRRENIGFVTQNFHLLDDRNVYENVALPLKYLKLQKKQIRNMVETVLDDLEIKHIMDRDIATLSGGERQRVAIGRAIVKNPSILLADEPTGSLDEKTEESILRIFDVLNKRGMTLIIVTHDDSVASYCKYKYLMHDKKLNYYSI